MKKTTKADFELFKSECEKWINYLKLDNWKVYYSLNCSDSAYAEIVGDGGNYVATISFCKEWDDSINPKTKDTITDTARHEILHLLIERLWWLGKCRYVTPDELLSETESIVRKLENIIPKVIS